ncbi:type II toxin-antitoxin system HicA family toxin [Bosea caraganae]|uniref:Type II toxin-antitoxin system HicA family toxin n=2 Tax=Bosea caraganae TaxID=2763117 RepID=A0A370KZ52_9HYPH|nr:type II toxin-antitoxin system HicA family toxin [Bosea caraganae]RDJ19892.1 type II toxin-antitoxin system HicA family toxin [Bosea caraganae]RDJ25948.1 type II toxin-antitoxin system HicA family toxin [Bosea caraganae]
MARVADLLDRMRRNSVSNWTMADIKSLCDDHGISCEPPTGGGSHYKVAHPRMIAILTIPFRRPIKPVYIRKLVKFVDELRAMSAGS